MNKKKVIIDLIGNSIYRGLVVKPSNDIFNSGLFPLDFHRAFMSVKNIKSRIITKRMMDYATINYGDWIMKYFDPNDNTFNNSEDLMKKYPDKVTNRDGTKYLSLEGFAHSIVKPEWTSLDDLLDYMLENEEVIKKENQ